MYRHTHRHNDTNDFDDFPDDANDFFLYQDEEDDEYVEEEADNGNEVEEEGNLDEEEALDDFDQDAGGSNDVDGYYQEVSDNPPHHHSGKIIASIIAGVLILCWLAIVPLYNLSNVHSVDTSAVMQIRATTTGDSVPEYSISINYDDNGWLTRDSGFHLLRGDTLNVTVDIFQFPGYAAQYQLDTVTSYNSNLTQEQNDAVPTPSRSIQLQGEDNSYFHSLFRSPLMQVTTVSCAIPFSQITGTYNLTLQASSDDTWRCTNGE